MKISRRITWKNTSLNLCKFDCFFILYSDEWWCWHKIGYRTFYYWIKFNKYLCCKFSLEIWCRIHEHVFSTYLFSYYLILYLFVSLNSDKDIHFLINRFSAQRAFFDVITLRTPLTQTHVFTGTQHHRLFLYEVSFPPEFSRKNHLRKTDDTAVVVIGILRVRIFFLECEFFCGTSHHLSARSFLRFVYLLRQRRRWSVILTCVSEMSKRWHSDLPEVAGTISGSIAR